VSGTRRGRSQGGSCEPSLRKRPVAPGGDEGYFAIQSERVITVDEVERALSEIADIRDRVAASSRFRGFAPEAMAFGAALSLAVAMAQTLWPQALASDTQRYLAVWGAALTCCSILVAVEAIARTRSLHGGLARAMLNSTVRQLLPFALAGAVIAVVVCRSARDAAWVVPGTWQMLVGLAGFSAAPSLPREIVYPAAWYFASGVVALLVAAASDSLSPWLMGLPFAVGQTLVALVLKRANGATHDR
jgi:hypothetical protein